MKVINLHWLAELHDHSRSKRSKRTRPRTPARAEIATQARALAAERMKLAPDDPMVRAAEEEAAVVQVMLDSQAMLYERKLTACYTIIATLGCTLALALVALVLP